MGLHWLLQIYGNYSIFAPNIGVIRYLTAMSYSGESFVLLLKLSFRLLKH